MLVKAMNKVSVIVPIYNKESYLRESLDSLINQTINELEIILIDDKSTDSSLSIVKEYANKDKRIKVIELDNNVGVSEARNIGLKLANAEYIGFLDADDYIDNRFFEVLYEKAIKENSDIVKGKQVEINLNNEKKDQLDFDYSNSPLYFSVGFWSAIYKSSLLKDHNIKFRKESSLGEDLVFLLDVTTICNKMIYTKEVSYYYVERDSSLSNSTLTTEKLDDLLNNMSYILNKLESEKVYDSNKNVYIFRYLSVIHHLLSLINKTQNNQIKAKCLQAILKYKSSFKYKNEISI